MQRTSAIDIPTVLETEQLSLETRVGVDIRNYRQRRALAEGASYFVVGRYGDVRDHISGFH